MNHLEDECIVLVAVRGNGIVLANSPIKDIADTSVRNAIAMTLGIAKFKVRVEASPFAFFIFAPHASRIVADASLASIALNSNELFAHSSGDLRFRTPHRIVARAENRALGSADLNAWRESFCVTIAESGEKIEPLVQLDSSDLIVALFVDKRTASRVINNALGLTPPCETPTEITIKGVHYTVDWNWDARPFSKQGSQNVAPNRERHNHRALVELAAPAVAPHPPAQAARHPPSYRQAVLRSPKKVLVGARKAAAPPNQNQVVASPMQVIVPPTPSNRAPAARATVFHDAENCWLSPQSSGMQVHARLVDIIRQAMEIDNDQRLDVKWNLVLPAALRASAFRPSRHAKEELIDLGVTMIDPGTKRGATDTRIRELIGDFLDRWLEITPEAQANNIAVLISGDRDFSLELRALRAAGVRVLLISGPEVRPVIAQLAWKRFSHWEAIAAD